MKPFMQIKNLLNELLETSIDQITTQVTHQCNFFCSYCTFANPRFYHSRGYGEAVISLETAKACIDFVAKYSVNRVKENFTMADPGIV